ncbi:LPO_1073/Vpar_1526 family protein [Burkholderia pyrrocinia]|uniref:LPO_1073/Vpar_1526 family protein n=1 Tax=Burkholderia pyrrocinia TaxID=60550 RepID=UPI002AB06FB0|nr:LPO_1073/Vpar_1526 family protein [Burkholderia pyrrocinia]
MGMLGNEQSQQGGDNAVNAQAGRDVIVQGITYADARQIAVDVYRANALEMQGLAKQVASERAEHLIDQFLQKMQATGAPNVSEAANPDFQHTLFEAQKAFARAGDDATETVLVNLLVQRATENTRNIRQVVLNEAVTAVARLTPQHIDLLSLVFLLRHCSVPGITSRMQLMGPLLMAAQFTTAIPEGNTVCSYLVYAGVAQHMLAPTTLQTILRGEYPGLLSRGFEKPLFDTLIAAEPAVEKMLMPSECNPELVQVRGHHETAMNSLCEQLGISEQARFNLAQKLQERPLADNDIEAIFAVNEATKTLFRTWNISPVQQYVLTSVGQAIGHANAVRYHLVTTDLGVWIK